MVILIKQKMKKQLLKKSENGLLIFKYFIPELQLRGDKCKNVHSPLYKDSNPSLSIFRGEDGIWYFKDFGDEEMKGDAFYFASLMWDLDCKEDFPKLMEELSEIDFKEVSFDHQSIQKNNTNRSKKESTFQLIERENGRLYINEKKYLKQFGITEAILADYNVKFIDGYIVNYLDGGSKQILRKNVKERIMLAYVFENFAKIYVPFEEKKDKFRYVGTKPENYVFGEHLFGETDKGVIFLAAGEKDVMTIAGLGYRAICLNSETSTLSKDLQKEIYQSGLKLLSLYDFDKTGRTATNKLQQDEGIPPLLIPTKYRTEGKDISDFVMAGMTKEQFDKRVNLTLKKIEQEKSDVEEVEEASDEENSSPFNISYNDLPPLFAKCIAPFDVEQERKLILLSSLVVVGSLLHRVRGSYRDNYEGTNLFLFIVADAASGKSKMKFTRGLGLGVHNHLKKMTKEADELTTLFIPADSSSAAFLKALDSNNGNACLFEPEADRLSKSLESDWSDFSTVMRCAYHHEPISYMRKTNNERVEIENPFLAILLSGTPLQVPRLFGNTEDGLFSRFAFLNLNQKPFWDRNLHIRSHGLDLNNYFKEMGDELLEMYLRLERLDKDVQFGLSEMQWEIFHDYYEGIYNKYVDVFGATAGSSIKRLGLMTFKIAMILTASRYLNSQQIPTEIVCKDKDFLTSLALSELLIDNFINIYIDMKKTNLRSLFPNNIMYKFYMALPKQFNRAEYAKVATDLGINLKTAENYVSRKFVEMKVLEKEGFNLHVKMI